MKIGNFSLEFLISEKATPNGYQTIILLDLLN
jgi:hypothetical protein